MLAAALALAAGSGMGPDASAAETRTLSVNFAGYQDPNLRHGIHKVSAGASAGMAIGLEGYAVPGGKWVDCVTQKNGATSLDARIGGITLKDDTGDAGRYEDVGLYLCSKGDTWAPSTTKPAAGNATMLYLYLDNANGNPQTRHAGFKLTRLPFTRYDAVVYFNTDTENAAIPAYEVNGVWYKGAAGGAAPAASTDTWGAPYGKTAPEAGVNTLVVTGLTGPELTVRPPETSAGRGCIAGFQVRGELSDAVVWAGGDGLWGDAGKWALPAGGGAARPVRRVSVNGEEATVRFAPSGPGLYHFYYLPYQPETRHGPFRTHYFPQESAAEVPGRCVRAEAEAIECRTARDSFWPMEICATDAEAGAYRGRHAAKLLLFPEDRMRPIRMRGKIPREWLGAEQGAGFEGTARANEYYCFQIGVWNCGGARAELDVEWGLPFPATCFNTEGVDARGRGFTRKVAVEPGRVQALWFGLDVPADAAPGRREGSVTIRGGGETHSVPVAVTVAEGAPLEDRGDSDPYKMTRLRWLNSRLGQETETPPETEGLPEGMTASAPGMAVTARTRTEPPDGEQIVRIALRAEQNCRGARFTWKLSRPAAGTPFFMGLGSKAQKTPSALERRWGQGDAGYKPWDSCWLGSVTNGVFLEFRGAAYTGPLLGPYRAQGITPPTWGNGVFKISREGADVTLTFTSDPFNLDAGKTRTFELAALPTPQHRLDFRAHFTQRYYHATMPSEQDYRDGVKVVNIHHANELNPIINYPFLTADRIRDRAETVHAHGAKLKIYYTIRELTSALPELWALRSLGDEIFADGNGGGFPWLCEHLRENYCPEWYAPLQGVLPEITADAALKTAPNESRWLNYYVEGLNWMIRNAGIDGVYLDDVMFDRPMVRRMRRVMDAAKPGCLIDLHSNTAFSLGPAMQYAGFFPYIDKLWFGESFKYDEMTPEQMLVEVSGIPFGLTADMLSDGGNSWLGMQYGMTPRLPGGIGWNPKPVWRLWDAFGIADSEVLGWWDPACPVATDRPAVKATAYLKTDGKMLVSVGNYSDAEESVGLSFSRPMRFDSAPDILDPDFQKGVAPGTDGRWRIPPRRGLLLIFVPAG